MSAQGRIARLEARIDALESREAITALVHAYATAVREGQTARCLELMTDDAVIEVRHGDPEHPGLGTLNSRYAGKGEIRASFAAMAGESAQVWPMIHNLEIVLAGDQAKAACVMMSAIWPHGKQYVGEYRDTFRREAGVWKFASRAHIVFGDSTGRYSLDAYADYVAAKGEIGDS